MQIFNQSNNSLIASHVERADTAMARLRGLLGRDSLSAGHAMIISECRSIHMFFMRFAIDVIFVDRSYRVVGVVKNIKPFAMSPYFFRAHAAIELPAGTIAESKTNVGDELVLKS